MANENEAATALAGLAQGEKSNDEGQITTTRRSARKPAKKMESSDDEEPTRTKKKRKSSPKPTVTASEMEKDLKKRLKNAAVEIKRLSAENAELTADLDEKYDLVKAQADSLAKYKQLCGANGVSDLRKELQQANKRIQTLESKYAAAQGSAAAKDKEIKASDKWKQKYYESQDSLGKAQVKVSSLEAQLKVYEQAQKKSTAVSVLKAKASATGNNQRRLKQLSAQLQKAKEVEKEARQDQKKQKDVEKRTQSIAFLSQQRNGFGGSQFPNAFAGYNAQQPINYQQSLLQQQQPQMTLLLQQLLQQQMGGGMPSHMQMPTVGMQMPTAAAASSRRSLDDSPGYEAYKKSKLHSIDLSNDTDSDTDSGRLSQEFYSRNKPKTTGEDTEEEEEEEEQGADKMEFSNQDDNKFSQRSSNVSDTDE